MRKFDGKKFLLDEVHYLTEAEVKEKMMDHDKEGFETRRIKKDGKLQVYTRQIAAEIVLKEGGQPL